MTIADKVQSIDLTPQIIDKTINEIINNPKYDNFIFFIHGRGKHPEKAFKKHILVDLESDYSAKVIMFHWPSWEGKFAFPSRKARKASNDLLKTLKMIESYKIDCGKKCKNIKFTLFSNSMGSSVLEQAMRDYDGSLSPIFDTLLINASSSLTKPHSTWVDKINFSEQIYITINP